MLPVGSLGTTQLGHQQLFTDALAVATRRERNGVSWQQSSGSALLVLKQAASGERLPQLLLLWAGRKALPPRKGCTQEI